MKDLFCVLAVLATFCSPLSAIEELKWHVGESLSENIPPQVFHDAKVPGAVQLDFATALNYPDYKYSDNSRQFEWMEDRFYTYETSFKKKTLDEDQRLLFVSEGIDYRFKIYLNSDLVGDSEGMFSPVEIDITGMQKAENTLRIVVFPAPKAAFDEDAFGRSARHLHRTLARKAVKPAVSYGWDFHPRLISLGIYGKTGLKTVNRSRFTDVYMRYSLAEDYLSADITLAVEGTNLCDRKYVWCLRDADGKVVLEESGQMTSDVFEKGGLKLHSPSLWWPNGYGTPYLYTSELRLLDESGAAVQTTMQNVGFKRVRMIPNDGAWLEPTTPEKTRSVPPMQVEINGRKIFTKGSSFLSPNIFYANITHEMYAELADLAVQLNWNMLRCWGGAPVAKEAFFDICDKKGLLIWQEFPLACNQYPDDAGYLKVLEREASSIVKRLRKHVCLARWCGGNELFNDWSRMTEQSLPLRALDSVTYRLNPEIPFNDTSPVMGVAHGPYRFMLALKSPNCDLFEYFPQLRYTAYCEFGVPSMSPLEIIERMIPEEERFPVTQTKSYIHHHVYRDASAYRLIDDVHGNKRATNLYCGEPKDLGEQIDNTQYIQAQTLGFMFEEARRQKPYCSMVLNWCFNDMWEAGANQSIIAYPAIKKQAFYTVKNACRPFLLSARPAKFLWKGGERFSAKLFALNDSYSEFMPMKVNVKVEFDGETATIAEWETPRIEPFKNAVGRDVFFDVPEDSGGIKRFSLILEVQARPEFSSKYSFIRNSAFEFPKDNKGRSR